MINSCDILLDWLTFSGHFKTFSEALEFIGMEDYSDKFEVCPGRWFYRAGLTFQNEITIYMQMNDDVFATCINISGRGCRDIESFSSLHSIENLLAKIYLKRSEGFQVSRIDLALDVIDKNLDITKLIADTRAGNFSCRSKFYNIMESCDDGIPGYSIYFGKKGSNIFINIYDKRAERGFTAKDMENWTRIEIRLRHENAVGLLKQICTSTENLGFIYFGVLNNYLKFLKPNRFDSNKSRWQVAPYWKKILQHTDTLRVFYTPGVEYDYSKFEENFFRQYGSSIVTYLTLHTLYDLKCELDCRDIKPNSKQQFLIDNYEAGEYYKEI